MALVSEKDEKAEIESSEEESEDEEGEDDRDDDKVSGAKGSVSVAPAAKPKLASFADILVEVFYFAV